MAEAFDQLAAERLADELAINEAFPVTALQHVSPAQGLFRRLDTEAYWGVNWDSASVHRQTGTPYRGDDQFEPM